MHVFPASAGLGAAPASTKAVLKGFDAALDGSGIPQKTPGENLLIGTWNLRQFGRVNAVSARAHGLPHAGHAAHL